ncbi:MAG TPA: ABC transporter ATP-binding protein [Methanosarcina sp.]|nr:ABC transporter ATP-binding protein [Methanosarcina sp.]
MQYSEMAGDMVDKAVVTENLSKKYGDFEAVKNISFSIKKGTIFGLLGPNGAGKSTTIKILTCQFPPTSGTAYIGGLNTVLDAVEIKKKIGVVFESQNLYEELSVYENLNFFRRLYNSPKERISEVLKAVGMETYQKNKVKTFSKGMKQKIMISRALLNDPEVLFLDEPGSGLDPRSAREIRQMILDLKEQGKTILITTHNMEEADFLCDCLAIINKGSIIAMDTPANLKKRYGEDVLMIKTVKGDIYELPLNTKASSDIFEKLSENNQISLVHSKEATIEDVFIKLTGEKLTDES